MIVINILGTTYDIEFHRRGDDFLLEDSDGYYDETTKKIVICDRKAEFERDGSDWVKYRARTLRHEIIHAFLFESGLSDDMEHKEFGHEETIIDWFAIQYPKMQRVFRKLGIEI